MGGSLGDGRLEVGAHAHRQGIEPVAGVIQLQQEPPQFAEPVTLARRVRFFRRQAHQAAQRQSRQRGRSVRRVRRSSAGCDAGLRRFAAEPYLDADGERRTFTRALLGQALARSCSRSTVWTQSNNSATGRVLLLCSAPMKCQLSARPASARRARAPPGGSFRRGPRGPPSMAGRSRDGGWDLATPISVTAAGSRPAARALRRDAFPVKSRAFEPDSAEQLTYWRAPVRAILTPVPKHRQ